ncbi:MAG: hypothetical protein V3T59_04660, partial [Desulfobacterales bacterium]
MDCTQSLGFSLILGQEQLFTPVRFADHQPLFFQGTQRFSNGKPADAHLLVEFRLHQLFTRFQFPTGYGVAVVLPRLLGQGGP